MPAKRVLIAEDEENIVTSLEFLVRACGYEAQVARDGDAALRCVREFRPDLILLDIMLPRRSGFEVCREIRADPEAQNVKIIMLSARGRESEIDKGLELGADTYITKPFSTRELKATIARLMPV